MGGCRQSTSLVETSSPVSASRRHSTADVLPACPGSSYAITTFGRRSFTAIRRHRWRVMGALL